MSLNFLKFARTKIISLTLALLGGLAVTLLVSASGPAFAVFPIGYNGAQNTDYPLLDGRNVTAGGSYSTSQDDHDNGITANAGDTVEFIIYYHNGAADAPENTAHNVRVRAILPNVASNSLTVSAAISADNASTVTSSARGGDITVHLNGAPQTLTYISGSTVWYPERSSVGQALPDGIVSDRGVNIGDIRGCWNFAGYVKFRARVGQSAAATLTINKTVATSASGSFVDSVSVNASDLVYFRIITEAQNADASNVIIRDILPSGLIYQNNTTKVNGVAVSDSTGLFGSGYNYGLLPRGGRVEITFAAQTASAEFFNTSQTTTLTNTANARGDNVSTVQDTANVLVYGTVANASFTLSKSAYNQTQGVTAQAVMANPGDVINYTLSYRNTGSITMTNVVIEDDLTDVLKLADVINLGQGQMIGNTIRFPPVSVPPGVAVDKTFQVRVRDVINSTADLTMTNIYGNRVDIQIRPPIVKGVYYAPKTGPKEDMVFILAFLATAAFYIYHKYPRRQANHGINS
jgi:uncharacterized repeat protein (TIGR01451 family)